MAERTWMAFYFRGLMINWRILPYVGRKSGGPLQPWIHSIDVPRQWRLGDLSHGAGEFGIAELFGKAGEMSTVSS
jgi:hypothetical protein